MHALNVNGRLLYAFSDFDGPLVVIWFETIKIFTCDSSELVEVALSTYC